MKKTKTVDLGEYIVIIEYNSEGGQLDVTVLDEGEGVIESISISNDDSDDEPEPEDPKTHLN